MIELKVFLQEIAVLLERFDRKLSKPVIERYYQILNECLNTEEFLAASMASFREDTFFPSPQSLIDRGKASGKGTRAQIVKILKERNLPAILPDHWIDKAGVVVVADLNDSQALEFLQELRGMARAQLSS